jgi:DNA repair exonuclease SbcCD ATPase subunit
MDNNWLMQPVVQLVPPQGRSNHGPPDIDTVMRQAEDAQQRTVQLEAQLLQVNWEAGQRVEQLQTELMRWHAPHHRCGGKGLPLPAVTAVVRSAERVKQYAEHMEAAVHSERQRAAKLENDLQRALRLSEELAAQLEAEVHHAHLLACANNERIASVEAELERQQQQAHLLGNERLARVEADLDRLQQCTVCLVAPRSVLIRSCGHLCLCEECAIRLMETSQKKKCPCCRTSFFKKNLVFGIKMP